MVPQLFQDLDGEVTAQTDAVMLVCESLRCIAVNICPLLLLAEEHEKIQGPEGGRDAVAFGNGGPHGCLYCSCTEFPVSRVFWFWFF